MTDAPYFKILSQPAALWTANCNQHNVPEIVRSTGVAEITDLSSITLYVSERYSRQYLKNFETNRNITLAATNVPTFESYQYKGLLDNIRPCTPDEEKAQRIYLDRFTDVIGSFGYSKELVFNNFNFQPSFAVTFRVNGIFEQTPYKSTGGQVIKLQ